MLQVFMQTHLHANAVVFNVFTHFVRFPAFSTPLALTTVLHGAPRSTSYFLVSGCCAFLQVVEGTKGCHGRGRVRTALSLVGYVGQFTRKKDAARCNLCGKEYKYAFEHFQPSKASVDFAFRCVEEDGLPKCGEDKADHVVGRQ